MDSWKKLIEDTDARNIYVGGTCALLYALDFDDYVNSQASKEYASILFITNTSGCDKRELVVFGEESFEPVSSLPAKYFRGEKPQVNALTIYNFLSQWNNEIKCIGRSIKLVINLPGDIVQQLHFSNIEIIDPSELEFIMKSIQKLVSCFKYHYRKLQIIKNIVHGKDSKQMKFLDYLNMISAAWHSVSKNFIYLLFYSSKDLSVTIDEEEEKLSLTNWCTRYMVPVEVGTNKMLLDDLVLCDNHLQTINFEDEETQEVSLDNVSSIVSGVEAHQAMKRLISYLRGEGADYSIIQSAKLLEDHLEHGALKEIQQVVTTSDQI